MPWIFHLKVGVFTRPKSLWMPDEKGSGMTGETRPAIAIAPSSVAIDLLVIEADTHLPAFAVIGFSSEWARILAGKLEAF